MSVSAEIFEDNEELVLEASDARELTRQIKVALEHSYTLIIAAYRGRAWRSMGYSSWDSYCQGEFGNLALQPPREERQSVVMSMREAGMSISAIRRATGLGQGTVHRSLTELTANQSSTVPNGTVEDNESTIVGLNGKSYRPTALARPARPSVPAFEDVPLSDELRALSPSEMGIAALTPSAFTSRPARERRAAARRLTGTMDSRCLW
jgi:transposase-like protein